MSATLGADPELLAARDELSEETLTTVLRALVRTPSVNPDEGALATLVAEALRATAAEVHLVESLTGRSSVAAVVGSGVGPTLVLNGHLDTVPVDDPGRWSVDPFAGEMRDGYLYGRGACDMKAALAIQLVLARLFGAAGALRGRLVLHFAIGEENAEPGTASLLAAGFGGDVAVVGEPTRLQVGVAARGLVHVRVRLSGRSGHASRPDLALNPLAALADLLGAIDDHAREVAARTHPLLPPGSCTPTMVRAGVKENSVPDECTLVLDRRMLPGDSIETELADLAQRLAPVARRHGVALELERVTRGFEPVAPPAEPHAARRLARAVAAVSGGHEPQLVGMPYACDASDFALADTEVVVFGAGDIVECHCADERVSIADVRTAALSLALFACELLL